MLQKLQNLKKKESGFTIIEVMIVLAVAGLIMVIVLVAVPQLQRNQRNAARKEVVSRISSEVTNYSGNNNGEIPTADTNTTSGISGGFLTRYITTSNIDIKDPSSGSAYTFSYSTTTVPNAVGVVNYGVNTKCLGESITTGTGNRSYSLSIFLEGGAIFCVDNSN